MPSLVKVLDLHVDYLPVVHVGREAIACSSWLLLLAGSLSSRFLALLLSDVIYFFVKKGQR